MMTQNKDKKRGQIQIFCMDDMVPQDHLLRIIDKEMCIRDRTKGGIHLCFEEFLKNIFETIAEEGVDTVSYTHLDVYKRQA